MSDFTAPTAPGRHSGRVSWLRALGSLISLALVVYLLSQQGWQQIADALRKISAWRLLLALALMFISRLSVTARWHTLLRSAAVKDVNGATISFRQTVRITFAGLFASNFLPTTIGGDLARLAGILQLRFDAAICAASLIVDRLVGMTGMAMAVPFSLPVLLNLSVSLSQHARAALTGPVSGLADIPVGRNADSLAQRPLLLSLAASSNSSGSRSGRNIRLGAWGRTLWSRTLRVAGRLYEALKLWLKQPRALLISLAFSWLHMLCLFSVIYLLMEGMGEQMPLWMIGGLYSLVYFITLTPISINGYGLQEISMTFIFSNLGNAPVSAGLTAALLFRTMMMTASLPGVIFLPGIIAARQNLQEETAAGMTHPDDRNELS